MRYISTYFLPSDYGRYRDSAILRLGSVPPSSPVCHRQGTADSSSQRVRLEKAYTKLAAFLVDKLGLPEEEFPLPIDKGKRSYSESLLRIILQLGSFGKNVQYQSARGPIHAIEHLVRICKQGWHYTSYAPAEVLWRVPYMIKWWLTRIIRELIPCKSMQSVFNRV